MIKVKLNIRRVRGVGARIQKIVEVDYDGDDKEVIRMAKLQFLNEYINRDDNYPYINNLQRAKQIAGLDLDGEIL